MRNFVLGLVVCGCVAVNGMELNRLADEVVASPRDTDKLKALVSSVTDDNDKTLKVCDYIHSKIQPSNTEELTFKQLLLYRVCSMLYQLSRDIRTYGPDSIDHYVYGAIEGNFGPFED